MGYFVNGRISKRRHLCVCLSCTLLDGGGMLRANIRDYHVYLNMHVFEYGIILRQNRDMYITPHSCTLRKIFQPLSLAFQRIVFIQMDTLTHERHRQIPLLTTTSNQEQKGQFTSLLEANDKYKQRILMVIAKNLPSLPWLPYPTCHHHCYLPYLLLPFHSSMALCNEH